MSEDRVTALRRAVDAAPDDPALRLLLAETLATAGRAHEALEEFERLLHAGALGPSDALHAGNLACDEGRLDIARGCLEAARAGGAVEGVGDLQQRVDELLDRRGAPRARAGPPVDPDVIPGLVEALPVVRFSDVGGLDDVKKVINRMIVLPLSRPDLYERYGRQAGGGVLLYGPPGCGKTLLARATAGECELPFLNVRIEQILDPFIGVSERNMRAVFEQARVEAPCVLFLDEIDALGFARRKQTSSSTRALVDMLLQELDGFAADNRRILVLAATNAPWDVDEALLRPGRFDRRVFVPPPDEEARARILEILLVSKPAQGVDRRRLARETVLFSGADLKAVVDQAVDTVIDEALESGGDPPLREEHLRQAAARVRPTTIEWLERARNHVEFANFGERYGDVAAFLRSREVRRQLG